jgi:hypothetical protein
MKIEYRLTTGVYGFIFMADAARQKTSSERGGDAGAAAPLDMKAMAWVSRNQRSLPKLALQRRQFLPNSPIPVGWSMPGPRHQVEPMSNP